MLNNNTLNKEICIFGVLANERGLDIEKSMLKWLLSEYDVYIVYQKFPGELYEYPALRFAQWFSLTFNISIIFYIHTKGAFNQFKSQQLLIELWKYEFTGPRKYLYINSIKNNSAEVTCIFRSGNYTLFNAVFISIRAFKLIDTILFQTDRYFYERLFQNNKNIMRVKGVLNDSIEWYDARKQIPILLKKSRNEILSDDIFLLNILIITIIFSYIKKLIIFRAFQIKI